jgi:hypothetical protein
MHLVGEHVDPGHWKGHGHGANERVGLVEGETAREGGRVAHAAGSICDYAIGVVLTTDADNPLTANQQALLDFVSQHQLFLNQSNWIRYSADQLKPPSTPGVGELWIDTQFESVAGQNTSGTVTVVGAHDFDIRMKVDGTSPAAAQTVG